MSEFPSKKDYYLLSIPFVIIIIAIIYQMFFMTPLQILIGLLIITRFVGIFVIIFWLIPKFLSGLIKGLFVSKRIIQKQLNPDIPRFVEDNLFPWQAIYLYSEGHPDYEDLILSYIFWLGYKQQLVLKLDQGRLQIVVPNNILAHLETNPLFLHYGVGFAYAIKYNYMDLPSLISRSLELQSEIIETLTSRVDKYYKVLPNSKLGDKYMPLIMLALLAMCALVTPLINIPFVFLLNFINRDVLQIITNLIIALPYLALLMTCILNRPINTLINNFHLFNQDGYDIKGKLDSYNYYLEKVEIAKLAHENNLVTGNFQTYNRNLAYAVAFGYLRDVSKFADKITKLIKFR